MKLKDIKTLLDEKVDEYNRSAFIDEDPIFIPHQFSDPRDIEVSAFLTATIAWGSRKAILKSAENMMNLMEWSPFDYVMNSSSSDQKDLDNFVHRTFNSDDLRYFVAQLKSIFNDHKSIEEVFSSEASVKDGIIKLHHTFFGEEVIRTRKHLANPERGSAAKRINMFLRWMVRNDGKGVDFGLWKEMNAKDLMLPLDVHTGNVGRDLGILKRKQNDWKAVEEISEVLRAWDPSDPVKYDFALFGMGVNESKND